MSVREIYRNYAVVFVLGILAMRIKMLAYYFPSPYTALDLEIIQRNKAELEALKLGIDMDHVLVASTVLANLFFAILSRRSSIGLA